MHWQQHLSLTFGAYGETKPQIGPLCLNTIDFGVMFPMSVYQDYIMKAFEIFDYKSKLFFMKSVG